MDQDFECIDDELQVALLASFQSRPSNVEPGRTRASSREQSITFTPTVESLRPPIEVPDHDTLRLSYSASFELLIPEVTVTFTDGSISPTHPFLKANKVYKISSTADAEQFVEMYLNTHQPICTSNSPELPKNTLPALAISLLQRGSLLESVERLLNMANFAAIYWWKHQEHPTTDVQMVSARNILLALKIEKGPLSPGDETLEAFELLDQPNLSFESVDEAVSFLFRYAATNDWEWREVSDKIQVNGRHKKALAQLLQAPLEVLETLYSYVVTVNSRIAGWSRPQLHTERLCRALAVMTADKLPLRFGYPSLDADTTYQPETLTEAITFIREYINTGRGIVLLIQERDRNHPQLTALRFLMREASEQDLSLLVSFVESFITSSSPVHVQEAYHYLLRIQLIHLHSCQDGPPCSRTSLTNFTEGDIYVDDNLKLHRVSPDWGFNGPDHHCVFSYEDEHKLQITCCSDDKRNLLYCMLPNESTDKSKTSFERLLGKSFERLLGKWRDICDPYLPHLNYINNARNTINGRQFIVLSPPEYHQTTQGGDASEPGLSCRLAQLLNSLQACYTNFGADVNMYDQELVKLMALQKGKLSQMRRDHSEFWLELSNSPESLAICNSLELDKAHMLMEALQGALDTKSFQTPGEYKSIFRLLRRFTRNHNVLPRSLIIRDGITEISQHPVGVGGNADVFRGKHNGRLVALKTFRVAVTTLQDDLFQNIAREALVWRQLNHENVLPFIGCYQAFGHCLVSLWMPNGNLATFVNANLECNRSQFCLDVAHGLEYLHEIAGLIHGDLRADNVLVEKSDTTTCARICDFGLSTILEATLQENPNLPSGPNGSIGSVRWLAPEYLIGNASKHMPGDVYAWACVCLEVFSGERPFEELKMEGAVAMAILRGEHPKKPESIDRRTLIKRGLHDLVWELMVSCWSSDPQNRPTMVAASGQFSKSRMRFS